MTAVEQALAAVLVGLAVAVVVELRRHGRRRALSGVPRVLSWAEAIKREGLA